MRKIRLRLPSADRLAVGLLVLNLTPPQAQVTVSVTVNASSGTGGDPNEAAAYHEFGGQI